MAKSLSELPVGSLVKDTGTTYNGTAIIWRVLEHGHTGDPAGTTALEARDILTLKCFDAKESGNSDSNRKQYGNNRYLHSNLLQWLNSNSAANSWYAAQHTKDAPPNSSNVWANNGTAINPYESEAGFLANFSADLRNALQTVTKTTAKNTVTDGGGYETVSSKIFLLSTTEVGLANENSIAEGSIYAYYSASNTNDRRKKNLANNAAKGNYSSATNPWQWWLRAPNSGYSYRARIVSADGSLGYNNAYSGSIGVSPACAILSSLKVSDSTDSDGCHTIIWNQPPSISTPSTSLGDKNSPFNVTFTITDADGDAVSAAVKLDGTTKQTIASVVLGQSYIFSIDAATFRGLSEGSHTIQITAADATNTSTTDITFSKVLSGIAISGSDGDLGNKWLLPSITYQITDYSSGDVTVVEKVDGETSRTIQGADLDVDIEFGLSGQWDNLSDEATHTLQIVATDGLSNTATRTWTFKKLAEKASFYTDTIPTDAAAKKISVVVDYEKTGNPTLKVEVSNDAGAIQRTWEDATAAVLARRAYSFVNIPANASDFGVSVQVTVTKNASTERVYIYSLGFCFA